MTTGKNPANRLHSIVHTDRLPAVDGSGAANPAAVPVLPTAPCHPGVGKRSTLLTIAVVALSALTGCVGSIREQENRISSTAERVAGMLEPVQTGQGQAVMAGPPGGGSKADARSAHDRFNRLNSLGEFRLTSNLPLGLDEILGRLSRLTGFQFLVIAGPDGKVVMTESPIQVSVTGSGPARFPRNTELASFGLNGRFRPDLRGTLPDILDGIAARYGLSWELDGKSVLLRQFTTRTYRVAALPSRTEFSGKIGAAGTEGSIDLPGEIEEAVRSLAGPDARMAYGAASGHVTVTARADRQRLVAEYVAELNVFLGKQVAFDVNVLSVTLSGAESAGVDLDLLAGEEDGDSVHWTGRHGLVGASGTINVGVLAGDVDLDVFIGALNRHGQVSVETRTGATTSNNRLVPIQVVSETAYARRVEAVTGAEGATRTTIEPGTLKTGFELNLLPRMLPDEEILLSYSIRLSDLNELAEFTSDDQTIQLPRVSKTSFEQQAIIGNEQTLVLMGFERNRTSHERSSSQGIPFLFGGRSGASSDRIATVLMIRPRILPDGGRSKSGQDSEGSADGR